MRKNHKFSKQYNKSVTNIFVIYRYFVIIMKKDQFIMLIMLPR